MTNITTISMEAETKARLDKHGKKNESYDSLMNRLLDVVEKKKGN